jgi:hypothetical protein
MHTIHYLHGAVLLGKGQKNPRLPWKPNVHCRIHNISLLDRIQSQFNPVHTRLISSRPLNHYPPILTSVSKSPSPFKFLDYTHVPISHLPCSALLGVYYRIFKIIPCACIIGGSKVTQTSSTRRFIASHAVEKRGKRTMSGSQFNL